MSVGAEQLLLPNEYGVGGATEPRSETMPVFQQLRLRLKSDEELMDCLQGGEVNALSFLFQRHSTLVFRIANRILRDHAEAEDTMQQIFLDIFRASGQFDAAKGSFKTWLLMFVYHRTLNRRRHLLAKGFYSTEQMEDVLPEILMGAGRGFPFSPVEAAVLIDEAMAMLKPRQRRTIELVYYEGLTAEEAATRTGETVRIVRHNLYRGLEKLRGVLCGERGRHDG
jgi:RNA polymerase sigma-70 factor, ECF subfamily